MSTLGLTSEYLPAKVENTWQRAWREQRLFRALDGEAHGEPAHVLTECPPARGTLDIEHIRSYSIADAYARYLRARGNTVLFSVGFEDLGPVAELEAARREMAPEAWGAESSERISEQLERLGFSFDFSRRYRSSEPEMYQCSQRLFLLLLEDDLVYRANGPLDWCAACQKELAAMQIEDGRCSDCGSPIAQHEGPRWYLRSSTYREENEQRLEELSQWNALGLQSQREVLGRVEGVEFDLASLDGRKLKVFTPNGGSVSQAEFIAISPRHPEIEQWIDAQELRRELERQRLGQDSTTQADIPGQDAEEERLKHAPMVQTGHVLIGANTANPLPVYVSPSVDARFGPTAVLGIPAVDQIDAALAQRISAPTPMAWRVKDDRPAKLRPAVRYRLHDLAISRQNAWGAPIPLIHCDACGTVPLPVADLPVRLPDDLRISGSKSTLTKHPDFVSARCPSCGGQARRETDTLDCHFNRLWQWIAFAAPHADRSSSPFEHPELDRWLAVNRAVLSADHGRELFDQRTTAKALRDRGLLSSLPTGEPYTGLTAHETVHIGGEDMSQPPLDVDELVSRAGADAVRLAVLYAAAPTNALRWSDNALTYCGRWLRKLWEYALPRLSGLDEVGLQPQIAQTDRTRRQLARWCDTAVTRITENLESLHMHKAVLNVMRLLERIEAFEQQALAGTDSPSAEDQAAAAAALLLLLQLLNPLAPHISEELWARAGQKGPLTNHAWSEDGRSHQQAGQRGAS